MATTLLLNALIHLRSLWLLLLPSSSTVLPADERDELHEAIQELAQRLAAANDVIGQADASMASMEEQVAAAAEGRRQAEEEAAAARAEAEALREAAADLQVGAAQCAAAGGQGTLGGGVFSTAHHS